MCLSRPTAHHATLSTDSRLSEALTLSLYTVFSPQPDGKGDVGEHSPNDVLLSGRLCHWIEQLPSIPYAVGPVEKL